MNRRHLVAASLLSTSLAFSLGACAGESTPASSGSSTGGSASQSSALDYTTQIQQIAEASGEKAFAQIDAVGPMITLTYLEGRTIMNGAGRAKGEFAYRSYDDFQDHRKFLPLDKLPVAEFGKALNEQQASCGKAQATGRLTVTSTGAFLQRLGCEATTTRLDVKQTTLASKPVQELSSLVSAASVDTILAEAKTMHGAAIASLELQPKPATEGEQPLAIVTAPAKPAVNPTQQCAQTSTRWIKPGAAGLVLDYADCAMTPPPAGRQLTLATLKGETIVKGIEQVASKLGVKPDALDRILVTPSANPKAITVQAFAGDKQASTTL